MSTKRKCQLTIRDFTILETLLRKKADPAFLRLLRLKLSTATFVNDSDPAPDVARIGSRVDFAIDDLLVDSRIIGLEDKAQSLLSLSITTMRGLALLGLKTGDTIIVEAPAGGTEKLKLHKIYRRADKGEGHGTTYPSARTDAGSVLTFAGLRKPPLLRAMDGPAESEEEDPGPFAA
jgi:regulator of nucleoside diphosphate kinase